MRAVSYVRSNQCTRIVKSLKPARACGLLLRFVESRDRLRAVSVCISMKLNNICHKAAFSRTTLDDEFQTPDSAPTLVSASFVSPISKRNAYLRLCRALYLAAAVRALTFR